MLLLLLATIWPTAVAQAAETAGRPANADGATAWPEPQRAFYQDGPGLLLPTEEQQELAALDAVARAEWIARFLAQDPLPATPGNELTEAIEARRRLVRSEFLTPLDVRARLLFLNGPPLRRLVIDCGITFLPMEIWDYPVDRFAEPTRRAPDRTFHVDFGRTSPDEEEPQPLENYLELGRDKDIRRLVVYQPGPDDAWRLWVPLDSKRAIYTQEMGYWMEQWEEDNGRLFRAQRFDRQTCPQWREVDNATGVRALRDFRPDRPTEDDLVFYLSAPADLAAWTGAALANPAPPEPARLEVGEVEVGYPEERQQRILARVVLHLPPNAGFELDPDAREPEARFTARGLLEQDGEIFEDFRLRFRVEDADPAGPLTLVVDRSLRPGREFVLRLEIEDEVSGAKGWVSRALVVPTEPDPESDFSLAGSEGGAPVSVGEELARQRIAGADSLVLVPPESEVLLGLWRAEALVTGERIRKVVFSVDGEVQLTRSKPPWTAEVRLAEHPTEQTVRAVGYDAAGDEVAKDEVVLNQPRGAFRVRITTPERGARVSGAVTAKAEITVPDGRLLERVEFKVDDAVVAEVTSAPWEAVVKVPGGEEITYLTVVAHLDDETRAEDVRFLNAPDYLENVEVNLIELYTAALDRNGRPVSDLTREDFAVREDGRPQEIVKFEHVTDLPLTVGFAIDTSGSMVGSLAEAKLAAADFLQAVIRPGDKTFAVAFSNRAALLMPPTDDLGAVVQGVDALQAVGWTALHDAVVTSLYYFRGIRGQKALVLLSDGDDTASSIRFPETLEYARRSGVAIYAIGLNVGKLDLQIRQKLQNLAEQTGGQSFFVSRAEELAEVYDEIELELRSRYLLAYNSDASDEDSGFREVEVDIDRRGLKARTIQGYYP